MLLIPENQITLNFIKIEVVSSISLHGLGDLLIDFSHFNDLGPPHMTCKYELLKM